VMLTLSQKFGKNKAFKDDDLFQEFTKITYPEIGEFFTKYVKGTEPLPLEEVLNAVGVTYKEDEKFMDYTLGIGNADIGVTQIDNKPKLQIATTDNLNAMGKTIGFQKGDVLVKINGDSLPDLGPELGAFIQQQLMSLPTSKTISYTVLRKDEKGEMKETELSAPVTQVELSRKHLLAFNPAATPEQLTLRDSWLKP